MAYTPRDFDKRPYSADEVRMIEFLRSLTHDIGGGDDPIGFFMASYRMLQAQLDETRATVRGLRAQLSDMQENEEKRFGLEPERKDSGC